MKTCALEGIAPSVSTGLTSVAGGGQSMPPPIEMPWSVPKSRSISLGQVGAIQSACQGAPRVAFRPGGLPEAVTGLRRALDDPLVVLPPGLRELGEEAGLPPAPEAWRIPATGLIGVARMG